MDEKNIDAGASVLSIGYAPERIYTNKAHQQFVVIKYDRVKAWMSENSNTKVLNITGLGIDGHGQDAYFFLFIEQPEQTPEKSAKDIALDKLTDSDKEALGIK
jgi:hypothetical protein